MEPNGKNVNASTAYMWNVTIPTLAGLSAPTIIKAITDDLLLVAAALFNQRSIWRNAESYTFGQLALSRNKRSVALD